MNYKNEKLTNMGRVFTTAIQFLTSAEATTGAFL